MGRAACSRSVTSALTSSPALTATGLPCTRSTCPDRKRAASPSELRVLRYLATNLSRPETASELSVSVNTVNTHIRNIHAKLQAGPGSLLGSTAAGELRLLPAGVNR
jgi:LuxR family transcriptional regulator, maltose regulon positive regulatory protein